MLKSDKNLIFELENYVYKEVTKEDRVTNEPIDKHNHHADGMRYLLYLNWLSRRIEI